MWLQSQADLPYEQARQQRILNNNKQLELLGLSGSSTATGESVAPATRKRRATVQTEELPQFIVGQSVRATYGVSQGLTRTLTLTLTLTPTLTLIATYGVSQGGFKKYPGTMTAVLENAHYTIQFTDNEGGVENVHARYILTTSAKLHDNTTPPDCVRKKRTRKK